MSQDNSNLDNCKYCGNKIDPELITKINERNNDVICQYCAYPLFINTNYNEEIKDDLKEIYKFNIYQNNRVKFGYYITIFAGRHIYNSLKRLGSDIELTDQNTELIANSVITEFFNHKIANGWLNEFKSIKKNFKRTYKVFQQELKIGKNFHEEHLSFFRLLIKVVYKLLSKEDYSKLQDIEYDIGEDLIKRDLFETNHKLTEPFRYNLKICLSRLIYLKLKDIVSKNKIKIYQLTLTEIEKRNIALDLIKYLVSHNEIIDKFLGKLEGIETQDFNVYYEQLCLELKSDKLFAESFNYHLRGLIGNIHDIICGKYKWRQLSNLYRIIITKLEQLLNVEVDFKSLNQNDDPNSHQELRKVKYPEVFMANISSGLINELSLFIYKAISENSGVKDHTLYIEIISGPKFLRTVVNEEIYDKILSRLEDNGYKKYISLLISDLIAVIRTLYDLNNTIWNDKYFLTTGQVNAISISRKLWNNNITMHYKNKNSFYRKLKEIIDFLQLKISDFNLKRRGQTNLSELEQESIAKFKKKLYCIMNIYNGKYQGKCPKCGIGVVVLPSLDFHHVHKELKGLRIKNFGLKYRKEINQLILDLEQEKVVLLCSNCHSPVQTNVLNLFDDLILKHDLFNFSADVIDKLIRCKTDELIKKSILKKSHKEPYIQRIYHWIKKRSVIEQLFSNTCVGCGQIDYENLAVIQFHHKEKIVNKSKWEKIKKFEIPKICEIIKKERMVALCSNCHRLLKEKHFINNLEIIFQGFPQNLINDVKNYYTKITNNINNFSYPQIEIKDPISRKKIHDVFENALTDIFKYLENENLQFYNLNSLSHFLGIKLETLRLRNNRLLNMDFIEKVKDVVRIPKLGINEPAIYGITQHGYEVLKVIM
jgi:hypothetical protein